MALQRVGPNSVTEHRCILPIYAIKVMISINNSIRKHFFLAACCLAGKVFAVAQLVKKTYIKCDTRSHLTFAVHDFSKPLALPVTDANGKIL